MSSNQKVNFVSLGCAKALVDSEKLLGALKNTNFSVVDDPEKADSMVINTCGFIDIARQESIDTILHAAKLKKEGKIGKLIVMGCLSERYPQELSSEIPEVDYFFGSNDHTKIMQFLTGKEYAQDDPIFLRSILTPEHYAYIKIAEGCDNGCSFCSIPIMRGLQKSRSIDSILWEAEKLLEQGIKELLVIAQDTTSYGWDLKPKQYLGDLISELDNLNFEWIRIHYAHPAHLSKKIIQSMADSKNVCSYLDMPIQHASDPILKSMRRGLNSNGIKKRIQLLREAIPDIRIRTTLIAGYPGETNEDFNKMFSFVEEVQFDRLGVFTYSEEDGTLAKNLKDDIPIKVKNDRKAQIMDLQADISNEKNQSMIGKTLKVVVDDVGEKHSVGRTEYDSPEIDNIVNINQALKIGQFYNIKIESANEFELIGSPSA
ncbi:MAG: 30S ribosomal protein S12 methylthiotransferase RimO [Candidatus Neomarinimicrobiota bacterium]|nr:30S ribosomal protein S12 methylthiotransferase RimO [Candidatus Neomarinimicrobiota bacterium]